MCRKDGEPGGPRRCGKHMAIRLASARANYQSMNHLLSEQQGVLESRSAWVERLRSEEQVDKAAIHRAEVQTRQARASLRLTLRRRKEAAVTLHHAQADYDSTREGLHELREEYDSNPADAILHERLIKALDTYEREANLREVSFGPQGPLSRTDVDTHGTLGERLQDLGATGWMKSSSGEDERTHLFEHRVNIAWHEGARRRSLTVPLLSEQPLTRTPGEVQMDGEPTLGEVVDRMQEESDAVSEADDSYPQWLEARGSKNSLAERQRWRAATAAAKAVKALRD